MCIAEEEVGRERVGGGNGSDVCMCLRVSFMSNHKKEAEEQGKRVSATIRKREIKEKMRSNPCCVVPSILLVVLVS